MVEEKLNDRHRRINRKERRGEGSYRHNDNHIRKIKTVSLVFYGLEPEVLDVSLTYNATKNLLMAYRSGRANIETFINLLVKSTVKFQLRNSSTLLSLVNLSAKLTVKFQPSIKTLNDNRTHEESKSERNKNNNNNNN